MVDFDDRAVVELQAIVFAGVQYFVLDTAVGPILQTNSIVLLYFPVKAR